MIEFFLLFYFLFLFSCSKEQTSRRFFPTIKGSRTVPSIFRLHSVINIQCTLSNNNKNLIKNVQSEFLISLIIHQNINRQQTTNNEDLNSNLNSITFQFIAVLALVAAANAGIASYGGQAILTPTITSQHQNTLRSYGNLGQVSLT